MFGAVSAGVPSFGDLSYKAPVRVVQVGDLPSQVGAAQTITRSGNGALPSIDGVSLAVGDRVLIAQQTNGYQEGIYRVVSLGSAGSPWQLQRTTDCDTASEMVVGASTLITEGDTWAGVTAVAGADWTPTSGDADWQPNPQLAVAVETFIADDTWTRPSPIGTYRVIVIGGGGGGGGHATTGAGENASGSGGGGGGTAIKLFQGSDLDATESIVVGNGGNGTTSALSGDGEASLFASTEVYSVEGGGGLGGARGNATSGSTRTSGGIGGDAFGGDQNIQGGDGGNGGTIGGAYVPIGDGGASYMAGGTSAAINGGGIPGTGYGGGGSGATSGQSTSARAGGDGAPGIVIVESYYIGRGSWT